MIPSVVARIEGGLGNQIFQYAAARSLADRLDLPLALDLGGIAANGDRPFQLDLYETRASILNDDERAALPDCKPSRYRRMRTRLAFSCPGVFGLPVFWPRGFEFDARFDRLQQPVYLVGYWQSERYFVDNRARLLVDLQLREQHRQPHPWAARVAAGTSVALHIRRGDYVSNAAAASFHGICGLDYYRDALNLVASRLSEPEIFVFSDDLDWARQNLSTSLPVHFVEGHAADQGHLDLELMRQCRHHIIANSSFSWWGAWLADSRNQLVVAPRQWFAAGDVNTDDVIPEHWIRL